jgi:hypothetical protein
MFAHEILTSTSQIEAHIQTGPKKRETMKKRTNFLKKNKKKITHTCHHIRIKALLESQLKEWKKISPSHAYFNILILKRPGVQKKKIRIEKKS